MSVILTICVPTYNRYHYLEQCLASIESATRYIKDEIEVLISNNASQDETSNLLNRWTFSNPAVKFKWITQEKNIGPLQNINFLANNAEGLYLLWCSDDDSMTPFSVNEALNEIKTGDVDFLRFALVVHDKPRDTLYLHTLPENVKNSRSQSKKFMGIFKLTHILTGTLVKREICQLVPNEYALNIYPMSAWCCLSFKKIAYSSVPFAIHTYGNEVHWGSDVEEASVGVPGNQSASDLVSCLQLIPEVQNNFELHKLIYRSFQGKYYSKAVKRLNFELRLPIGFKSLDKFSQTIVRMARLLLSARRHFS